LGCAEPAIPGIQAPAPEEEVGFLSLLRDDEIDEHMQRQERALLLLRWVPWLMYAAAAVVSVRLGWRWDQWSRPKLRRSIGVLFGAAIALPLLFTLIEIYPLFFTIDRPEAREIANAVSSALNALAFALLLDAVLLVLFLVTRSLRPVA
jgi:hypothetical protein